MAAARVAAGVTSLTWHEPTLARAPIPPQPTQALLSSATKACELPELAALSDGAQRFGFKANEQSQELYSRTWALGLSKTMALNAAPLVLIIPCKNGLS